MLGFFLGTVPGRDADTDNDYHHSRRIGISARIPEFLGPAYLEGFLDGQIFSIFRVKLDDPPTCNHMARFPRIRIRQFRRIAGSARRLHHLQGSLAQLQFLQWQHPTLLAKFREDLGF